MGDRIRHYALENRAVQVVEELLDSQNYIGKKGESQQPTQLFVGNQYLGRSRTVEA